MLKDNYHLYFKNWATTWGKSGQSRGKSGQVRLKMSVNYVFGLLIGNLLLLMPISVLASCDCPAITTEQAFEQADIVFVGKVVGLETNWISGGWKFSFEVEKSWKKKTNTMYIVNTGWEKDCGYIFEEGKSYLVYVRRKFTPKTDQCKGNMELEEAGEIMMSMGAAYAPGVSGQAGMMMMLVTILAILGLVFLGIVVLRKKNR